MHRPNIEQMPEIEIATRATSLVVNRVSSRANPRMLTSILWMEMENRRGECHLYAKTVTVYNTYAANAANWAHDRAELVHAKPIVLHDSP